MAVLEPQSNITLVNVPWDNNYQNVLDISAFMRYNKRKKLDFERKRTNGKKCNFTEYGKLVS